MKFSKIGTLVFATVVLTTSASAQLIGKKSDSQGEIATEGKAAFDQGVQEAREIARKKLKPYKYDATKSTYFSYKSYTYAKEVEIITLEQTDYKLCFNSSMIKDEKISLEIYDKPQDAKNRILLYSRESIGGDEFEVNLDDMNEVFKAKKKETTTLDPALIDKMRLKKVYINYIIPAVDRELEKETDDMGKQITTTVIQYSAMVLAVGYLNM
ncbi:MAG: hypothetical protein H6599_08455 [Flavobacteriales bacterium]|nr:hypothetical protein [Flavobacteriales bacterium]